MKLEAIGEFVVLQETKTNMGQFTMTETHKGKVISVGDKVEEWSLKGAMIQSANFGDMNFETNEPNEIILTLRYDYAILQF